MERISYIALLALVLLCACSSNPQKDDLAASKFVDDSLRSIKGRTEVQLENKKKNFDTLDIAIGKPQILAFSITQSEYDKLSDDEAGEYDEGYGDLMFYLGEFAKKVNGNELLIRETASKFIKIDGFLIDRKKLKSSWGLIFITKDGKYEVVCDGLLDSEILEKSKSMSPPLLEK